MGLITFARHEKGLGIWRDGEFIGVIEGVRLLRLIVLAAMIADERGM